jgi:D-lactate dehydrogenase (cytochrome)
VTIRLAPLLPTRVAVVQFPDIEHATRASIEALNSGANLRESSGISAVRSMMIIKTLHKIECIELLDKMSIHSLNVYNKHSHQWPEKDSLFIKVQGATQVFIEESTRILKQAAKKYHGTDFQFAVTEKDAEELWAMRKNLMFAGLAMSPGAKAFVTDVW